MQRRISRRAAVRAAVRADVTDPTTADDMQADAAKNGAAVREWVNAVARVPLERYATPAAVDGAFWQGIRDAAHAAGDELELPATADILHGFDTDGNTVQFTTAALLEGMEAAGVWGFTDTGKNPPIVHYWRSPDARASVAVSFFAHEFSHAVIEPLLMSGAVDSEVLAEVVSACALRAYQLAIGLEEEPAPGFIEGAASEEPELCHEQNPALT
jgi:hypothetical protein